MNSDNFRKLNTYTIEDSLRPDRDGLEKFLRENPQGVIILKDRPTLQINYDVNRNYLKLEFTEENKHRAIRNLVSEKLVPAVAEPIREHMARVEKSQPKLMSVGSK